MFKYNHNTINFREKVCKIKPHSSVDIHEIFMCSVISNVKDRHKILDLGTGNGYILEQIHNRLGDKCSLFGLENSKDMINRNIKKEYAKFIQGSNYNIPFENDYFDMVTAKNVTRISPKEIFRILKPNSMFIFREYGRFKGLKEISELFSDKLIRSRDPSYYVKKLLDANFKEVKIQNFYVKREYDCIEDILNIVRSFPYIKNFSLQDEKLIRDSFEKKGEIKIISDPFIITAVK